MTISTALSRVEAELDAFFASSAPELAARPGLVAFSGGPDSTALLAAAARRARRLGTDLVAAHLDHGLDGGSAGRAEGARRLAAALGVPVTVACRDVTAAQRSGESLEAAARRVRYRFLCRVARERGAAWVASAHHRDDQAETVVLRLLFGSGLRGLAGIRPVAKMPGAARRGRGDFADEGAAADDGLVDDPTGSAGDGPPALIRPLLELPRAELAAAADEVAARTGLDPLDDPTNRDLAVVRNLVRHRLLPALARRDGLPPSDLAERLAALAAAADGATGTIDRALTRILRLGSAEDRAAAFAGPNHEAAGERRLGALPLAALSALPAALLPHAAALLHARAGLPYPPPAEAAAELGRQLAGWRRDGTAVGCDCGGGRRWESRGPALALLEDTGARARPRSSAPPFSYTLRVPGEVAVPESGAVVRLRRAPQADWMLQGARDRAGLGLALEPGDEVTVRNRRPGDRIRPLGAPGSRRLKDLLIDRRVPRAERDRLPLLCVRQPDGSERIAWVPGVAVDESCRLPSPPAGLAWVAEIASRG